MQGIPVSGAPLPPPATVCRICFVLFCFTAHRTKNGGSCTPEYIHNVKNNQGGRRNVDANGERCLPRTKKVSTRQHKSKQKTHGTVRPAELVNSDLHFRGGIISSHVKPTRYAYTARTERVVYSALLSPFSYTPPPTPQNKKNVHVHFCSRPPDATVSALRTLCWHRLRLAAASPWLQAVPAPQ